MKRKRILMALLVALLAFVAVVAVASGHKVEIQRYATNNRESVLRCGGPASFRAKAVFWWTKDGKRVGTAIRFACRDNKYSTRKVLEYPRGANDFKVTIRMWDVKSGKSSTCWGRQEFTAGQVPHRYGQYCYLHGDGGGMFQFEP